MSLPGNDKMDFELIRYLGLLNILLYMDVIDSDTFYNSETVKEVIHDLNQQKKLTKNFKRRITILCSAANQDKNFANIRIIDYTNVNQCAALFQDQNNNYYIGFRGTRFDEWKDNVLSLSGKVTETSQQKIALEYFNRVVKKFNLDKISNKIYIFGHSKGGNKAQFVLLNTKYSNMIEKVYSYNAQTFSPEAIKYFKSMLPKTDFENRISKIYSICTDNDPINCLGYNKEFKYLINQDHITYLKSNLMGVFRYHFQDSFFNLDGTLTDITNQKKLSKKCQKWSEIYMSRSSFTRYFVGGTIVSIINAARTLHVDKIADSLAIKRENKILYNKKS